MGRNFPVADGCQKLFAPPDPLRQKLDGNWLHGRLQGAVMGQDDVRYTRRIEPA